MAITVREVDGMFLPNLGADSSTFFFNEAIPAGKRIIAIGLGPYSQLVSSATDSKGNVWMNIGRNDSYTVGTGILPGDPITVTMGVTINIMTAHIVNPITPADLLNITPCRSIQVLEVTDLLPVTGNNPAQLRESFELHEGHETDFNGTSDNWFWDTHDPALTFKLRQRGTPRLLLAVVGSSDRGAADAKIVPQQPGWTLGTVLKDDTSTYKRAYPIYRIQPYDASMLQIPNSPPASPAGTLTQRAYAGRTRLLRQWQITGAFAANSNIGIKLSQDVWVSVFLSLRGVPTISAEGDFLDEKKLSDGRVFTSYTKRNTVWIIKESNMGDIVAEVDTAIAGKFPNIEVQLEGGMHLLFLIDNNGNAKMYSTEDDFGGTTLVATIATGAKTLFTHRCPITGIIYVTWTDGSDDVWIAKLSPDGTKIPFKTVTDMKIPGIKAKVTAIIIKNGVACLKYIDSTGAVLELFSHDTGETWGATF